MTTVFTCCIQERHWHKALCWNRFCTRPWTAVLIHSFWIATRMQIGWLGRINDVIRWCKNVFLPLSGFFSLLFYVWQATLVQLFVFWEPTWDLSSKVLSLNRKWNGPVNAVLGTDCVLASSMKLAHQRCKQRQLAKVNETTRRFRNYSGG